MTMMWCRALFLALLFSVASTPALACSIVYGSDWAFVSAPPDGWESACGEQSFDGTNITLWPAKEGPSNAKAYIYVTVSGKDLPDIHAFAKHEQSEFKREAPGVQITSLPISPRADKHDYVLAYLKTGVDNREEIIAYLDGPSVYYIIVLTAASPADLVKYRTDFFKYLADFVPMDRK